MVTEEGGKLIVKLIDFNVAIIFFNKEKKVKKEMFEKTGQLFCRAPEMLNEGPSGYDERVDYWGATCCLY